jgi:hypothetical protein
MWEMLHGMEITCLGIMPALVYRIRKMAQKIDTANSIKFGVNKFIIQKIDLQTSEFV